MYEAGLGERISDGLMSADLGATPPPSEHAANVSVDAASSVR
jgi:hypothetical protein